MLPIFGNKFPTVEAVRDLIWYRCPLVTWTGGTPFPTTMVKQ